MLTAAVFLMTMASILAGNTPIPSSALRQGLEPQEKNAQISQGSSPELQSQPVTEGLHTTRPNDAQDVRGFTKSSTVSTYIQNKIAAWKVWHASNNTSPSSATFDSNDSTSTPAHSELSELSMSASDSTFPIRPTILTLSMLTSWDQTAYERALATHFSHAKLHNYPLHILRTPILSDIWSKPAYILSHLLRELAKSPGERTQWIWWFDADTIILNKKIPLEVFLPPATFDDVNLLVGHDWNGLNNGVYPLRVHPWSVELLTTILTYPIYEPDKPLPLRDQSAMADVLNMPRFKRHTAIVPMKWFNGYHRVINESAEHMMAKPGDLLVHLAGVPDRFAVMEEWLRKVEEPENEFEVDYKDLSLKEEIRSFWKGFGDERRKAEDEIAGLMREVEDIEGEFRKIAEAVKDVAKTSVKDAVTWMEQVLERMKKVFEDFYGKQDLVLVKNITEQLKEAIKPLQDMAGIALHSDDGSVERGPSVSSSVP